MAEVKYTCAVCGQEFTDEYTLSQHMITNHSTKDVTTEEGEEK